MSLRIFFFHLTSACVIHLQNTGGRSLSFLYSQSFGSSFSASRTRDHSSHLSAVSESSSTSRSAGYFLFRIIWYYVLNYIHYIELLLRRHKVELSFFLNTSKLPCLQSVLNTLIGKADIVRLLVVLVREADNQSLVEDRLGIGELVAGEGTTCLLGNVPLLGGGGDTQVSTGECARAAGREVLAGGTLGLESDLPVLVVREAPDLE